MPRHRTPSPELTEQDKSIVAGAALALQAIGARHRNEKLVLAAELANAFVDGAASVQKSRLRKPKAAPASTSNVYIADGAHAEV